MSLQGGQGTGLRGPVLRRPAPTVVLAFGSVIALGSALLLLPVASEGGVATGPVTALFTATSAVCVTGLTVVGTPGHWSMFGELVILGLFQLGGFGIMAAASLLGLVVARRVPMRMQLTAQAETKSVGLGEVRRVLVGVARTSLLFEAATAAVLTVRLWSAYQEPFGRAAYLGVFHAVSAFNQAGFALYPDSLARFTTDAWITLPVVVAVIAGGIGFPVLFELRRRLRAPRRWSLHTKLTVGTSAVLLVLSTLAVCAGEWSNPATLGSLTVPGKLLAGFFNATMSRSAGLSTVDVGEMHPVTWFALDIFMFIGGGSASTAGGIKVTTFALLAFVLVAEIRGQPTVHVLGRRLPADLQRQALTIALLSIAVVTVTTLVLLVVTPFGLDRVLFESLSAFGTVGLSTGITAELPPAGALMLTVVMFAGRVGPVTVASALALRERTRRYELPEERPIVG